MFLYTVHVFLFSRLPTCSQAAATEKEAMGAADGTGGEVRKALAFTETSAVRIPAASSSTHTDETATRSTADATREMGKDEGCTSGLPAAAPKVVRNPLANNRGRALTRHELLSKVADMEENRARRVMLADWVSLTTGHRLDTGSDKVRHACPSVHFQTTRAVLVFAGSEAAFALASRRGVRPRVVFPIVSTSSTHDARARLTLTSPPRPRDSARASGTASSSASCSTRSRQASSRRVRREAT